MQNTDVIFFIGRSGAGKGTQARVLAEKLGFFYWEMGGLLRAEIAAQTEVGKKIENLVNNGVFLGDQDMYPIIEKHLDDIPADRGIVFDGFPRRLSQAYFIMGLLRGIKRRSMTTLFLDVPREDSVERLHHRAEIEHRADDTDEVIAKRLDQFETETMPVVDYLETMTKFHRIDGRPPVDEVAKAIHEALGNS